jgi:DedD protein
LNDGDAKADANAAADAGASAAADASNANSAAVTPSGSEAAPLRTQKYDTHVPDTPPAPAASVAAGNIDAVPATPPASTAPVIITDKGAGAPTQAPSQKAAPAQAPSQKAAPAQAPKVAATPPHRGTDAAKAAHATPASQREGFAVQLAAFADDRGANSLAGRLKKAGYAAYTEPLKTSKGTLWRVRVGPYPSREAAVAARDKLKTEGQSGIVAAIK